MRADYDLTVNEDRFQQLLFDHQLDVVLPMALGQTFSGVTDLRRCPAFGGVFPDALGLIGERLALFELKHPSHWKTSAAALFQVLAYATRLVHAAEASEVALVNQLVDAFAMSGSDVDVANAVKRWNKTRTASRPFGDLSLVCIVLATDSWTPVVKALNDYGIDLRVITSSVIVDRSGVRALGWFESDPATDHPSTPCVAPEEAFRWNRPELQFVAKHPARQLALLPNALLKRSERDFAVRVLRGTKIVAVATPMTHETMLIEIADRSVGAGWVPFLIGPDDGDLMKEVVSLVADALAQHG